MALSVVSHYPTINATGVYRNEAIKVTFNKRIRTETIDGTTFSVNDYSNFTTVPGGYSIELDGSGNAYTAVFVPSIVMAPNRRYEGHVYAAPDSILALYGDSVDSTYSFSFTTVTGVWAEVGVSGLPASGYGADAPVDFSGAYDPDDDITSFAVLTTTPQHQEPNVDNNITGVAPSGILIEFNTYIASSLAQISGYITIKEEDVL
jgi:hypothetical protein